MGIRTIEYRQNGGFLINKNVDADDDRQKSIPNTPEMIERFGIQPWIDAGNVTPYDPAEGATLAKLKTATIRRIKHSGHSKLGFTDRYIIREVENGTTVPANVGTYRTAMRTAMNDAETEINALTTKQEVADYEITWPVKPGGV